MRFCFYWDRGCRRLNVKSSSPHPAVPNIESRGGRGEAHTILNCHTVLLASRLWVQYCFCPRSAGVKKRTPARRGAHDMTRQETLSTTCMPNSERNSDLFRVRVWTLMWAPCCCVLAGTLQVPCLQALFCEPGAPIILCEPIGQDDIWTLRTIA